MVVVSKPYQYLLSLFIYFAHKSNLARTLSLVGLIDANCVGPDNPLVCLVPDALEGIQRL